MSLSEQEYRDLVASFPRARLASAYAVVMGLSAVIVTVSIFQLAAARGKAGMDVLGIVLASAGAVGMVGSFVALLMHLEQVRAKSLAMIAERMGLDVAVRPARGVRETVFAPFAGLKMLRHGNRGIKLWFGGVLDGRRVDLIEHQYVVSTGKSAHTVTHTVAATPVPKGWPRISFSSRHALASWWASRTGNDFRVENEAFNARWIVKTDDPGFALLFLTPEVQEFLAEAPGAEAWHVAEGSLCRLVKRRLKPRDLPRPMQRVVELRAVLPPELDVWTADAAA